jgi:hypothetical protein
MNALPRHRPVDRGPPFLGLLDSASFMARMRPPAYLIDGVMERGYVYALTGNTGHGKTVISLALAFGVAHSGLFSWKEVEPGAVLFLAGENPENVRRQWYAHCTANGVDPANLPVYWHDGVFDLRAASGEVFEATSEIPDLRLVVVDTLQAFFAGDDANSNTQMLEAAREFRALTLMPARPTVLVAAHPVKRAARDNLLPAGGGAFLNEIDSNLTIWCEDGVVRLHHQGKHRGADFEPLEFSLTPTEPEGLIDARGRQMTATVAKPLTSFQREQREAQRDRRETDALRAIKSDPTVSVRALGEKLGVGRDTASRLRKDLERRKWITPHGKGYRLTKSGEAVLQPTI